LKNQVESTQIKVMALRTEKVQVAKQTYDIVANFNKVSLIKTSRNSIRKLENLSRNLKTFRLKSQLL